MDEKLLGLVWRWAAVAAGTGLAVAGLTALFLFVGLAPAAAPVVAFGLAFPPMFLTIRAMHRRAGHTGW